MSWRSLSITAVLVFVVSRGVRAQQAAEPRIAAEWIEAGQADLERFFFVDAEASFRKAIALDAHSAKAQMLLARALIGQLPPNPTILPELPGVLSSAEAAADRAVELSPSSVDALCVKGIVRYQRALTSGNPRQKASRLGNAMSSFNQALIIDPASVEAHYRLAQMFLDQTAQAVLQARFKAGMRPEAAPIADAELRHLLQARYSASITEGMSHAQRALETNASFEPAMSQMSLAWMLRANLRDDPIGFASDFKEAEVWQKKAASIRASRPHVDSAQVPGGILNGVIGSLPSQSPPPAPPPPDH